MYVYIYRQRYWYSAIEMYIHRYITYVYVHSQGNFTYLRIPVYLCVYIYIYIHIYIRIYIDIYIYIYICTCIYLLRYASECIYIYIYIYVYVCRMCVCVFACTDVYIYIYICRCIYTLTWWVIYKGRDIVMYIHTLWFVELCCHSIGGVSVSIYFSTSGFARCFPWDLMCVSYCTCLAHELYVTYNTLPCCGRG